MTKKLKSYEVDTNYFTRYNANPKNKKTGDCVIRALTIALNKDYAEVLKDLCNLSLEKGYAVQSKENYTRYLKSLCIEKQKQPRKQDNTKYTVKEFAEQIALKNGVYVVDMANHLSVIVDKKIIDTWNCGNKSVGNYWIIK